MYFKSEKKDTNIDDEFDNNDMFSKILRLISTYKLYIFIGIAIILIIIMYFIFINREVTNYLVINGEQNITLYQGADYIEPGYLAYNSKKDDLTNDVTIISTLDTSKIGEYEITYTIGNISETRKITIVEKPKEYTYIYLKTVNNDINLYIKKGEEYNEPGYQVFSSTGFDLTNQVKVTGNVDINKAGTYKLIYSVVDSNNVTISVSRTIIVMDSEINLSLIPNTPTNKTVTINIGIIDNYFDYLVLPDNTKITDKISSYNVNENGTYTFKVYNNKGDYKESSIEVKNIDKTKPTGSCSGTYGSGQSIINVTATDTSGIEKYYLNGKSYTSNKITINSEMTTVNITIYDKAGNTQNITCNLQKTTSKPSNNQSPSNPSAGTKPSTEESHQPSDAPSITSISADGVIIKVNAKKYNASISGYYFSYDSKKPDKKTGGYVATSNESIQVVRLPGTTYVWVEDTNGKVSGYKTINVSASSIINTDGKILKGTTLSTVLEKNGSSTGHLNKLIARSARAAGLYTKESAATTAVALVGVLDQQYGVRLPYRAGGKNNYVGVSGIWGQKINDTNYPYRGFDCDGFTHWSYINAGVEIDVSRDHNYWYWDRIPFSKEEGEIGDIISQYKPTNHVKIIVGKTNEGFIVAHANGKTNGVWINVHKYSDTEGFTIIKGSKIANYYSKNKDYPSGF